MKIAWLNNIPEEDLKEVGGKAKGLFLLNQLGLNVARGFVAYDISTPEDETTLYDYWRDSGLGEVAVRSSATLEDGVELSSAGQYET
ncbi:MAG TPA: PEP/pyruvate-binding domain-containing protein, partial [Bacilli bacterium]|nr:PEP/pyruvate-binding domain-containing protein [Bacilli bacterium]